MPILLKSISFLILAVVLTMLSATLSAHDHGKHNGDNAAARIAIHEPYARAVPPGQPNSAVFMTLKNTGAVDHAVIDAESPASNIVELHTHTDVDGVMKMRRIEQIPIPAQGETVLKPGGLHVMLIELKATLEDGAIVPVTLVFDDGSRATIQAPVRKLPLRMHPAKSE